MADATIQHFGCHDNGTTDFQLYNHCPLRPVIFHAIVRCSILTFSYPSRRNGLATTSSKSLKDWQLETWRGGTGYNQRIFFLSFFYLFFFFVYFQNDCWLLIERHTPTQLSARLHNCQEANAIQSVTVNLTGYSVTSQGQSSRPCVMSIINYCGAKKEINTEK